MTTIVSKPNCPFCVRAKKLLKDKGYVYEELIVGEDITRDELLELVPHAKTVPQIWLTVSDQRMYIGGYDQLAEYFNSHGA